MKLLGRNKLPGRLRESVEAAGGSVEMQVSALLRPIGFSSPTPLALAAAEQVIAQAGLVCRPPVTQSGWSDTVVVSFPAQGTIDETRAHEVLPTERDAMPYEEEPAETDAQQEQVTLLPEPAVTMDAVAAESYAERHRALEERLQELVERERE